MTRRILVIDDDNVIIDAFKLALINTDYQVDSAENGKAGFGLTKKAKYDLIYLDLKMPEWNGVKTLREIRKIAAHVPIYIITAFHSAFLKQLSFVIEDRIDFNLMKKPIDSEQILFVTNSVLNKKFTL